MLPNIINTMVHSPFFQGAGIVGMGGMLLNYIKTAPKQIISKIDSVFTRSINISHKETILFDEILQFINDNVRSNTHKAELKYDEDADKHLLKLLPFDENYRFRFGKKTIRVKLIKPEQKKDSGNSGNQAPSTVDDDLQIKSIKLSTRGFNAKLIKQFITTLALQKVNQPEIKARIPILTYEGYWYIDIRTDKRRLDTVLFDDVTLGQKIKDDIVTFLSEREWYKEMNIPHRRTYLLYGPPGNGKTSLIRALASELNYSIAPINLANCNDKTLQRLFLRLPKRTIAVIEDIDGMFQKNENLVNARKETSITAESIQNLNGLTLSGLLNAMDGLVLSDDRIIFMTTNHIDLLDPALLRPGRCDVKVLIDNPKRHTVEQMYSRFFPTDTNEEFIAQHSTGEFSTAQIQGKLFAMRQKVKVL